MTAANLRLATDRQRGRPMGGCIKLKRIMLELIVRISSLEPIQIRQPIPIVMTMMALVKAMDLCSSN